MMQTGHDGSVHTGPRGSSVNPIHLLSILLLVSVLASACGHAKLATAPYDPAISLSGLKDGSPTSNVGRGLAARYGAGAGVTDRVLTAAYSQYGKLYHFGGSSPKTGFDCSGFVNWCYSQQGIGLPRTSRSLTTAGTEVDRNDLRPGDILVFRRYRSGNSLHVGLYVGNGRFLHSPHTGDRVKENGVFEGHYAERFVTARRVVDDPMAAPLAEDRRNLLIAEAISANGSREEAVASEKTDKPARTARNSTTSKPKSAKAKSAKSETAKVYKIKKGDNLWTLAKKFGVSETALRRANNISSKHTLKIGQKIAIP